MSSVYDNIPELLRWERRWCIAGPDNTGMFKAPYAVSPAGLFHISPTQEIHLKDFETTRDTIQFYPDCGLGFVLFKKDGYTCIDLDIKNEHNAPGHPEKWTSQENIDRFHRIINSFDSYTERSTSGQGFHIWIKGSVGAGLKRDGVEIYSQERFIVCTGDVYRDRDVEPRQELLELLATEISRGTDERPGALPPLIEIPQTESDAEIFKRAREADNGDKFIKLCNGDFSNYPSQSEADLALLSIFAFYTKSNSQCRRMFRLTKLGERPKANKNDVAIDRSLKLIRARQATETKQDALAAANSAALLAALGAQTRAQPAQTTAPIPIPPPAAQTAPAPAPAPTRIMFPEETAAIEAGREPIPFDHVEEPDNYTPTIDWPPGFTGSIARYIYNSAPRPVREVAIVGALGLLAGICGKAFSIPQSGLNLYVVLVARSAIGKEAMHSGIANIMKPVGGTLPSAMSFVDFTDYASGPALSKAVVANQSFVNVSGEWGRRLRRLGREDYDGPMSQLRTVMTNLYQKSGPASIVGGIGYSDKEKNVASVSGVAYSMIGETTPDTFYEALTETMMADGFLSRFIVIEYTGDRPSANTNMVLEPDPYMMETLLTLMSTAVELNRTSRSVSVTWTPEAKALLDAFDKECDDNVRSTDDEGQRQMWNRAHLKAFRIAGLLAVADGHVVPTITLEHAQWGMQVIRKDISVMQRKMKAGDVGIGDSARERKVLDVIENYLKKPCAPSYKLPDELRADGIVPRRYLQICTQRASSFVNHRAGQTGALDLTIKSLIDSGYLLEISKEKLMEKYGFIGKCYRVVSLPSTFILKK